MQLLDISYTLSIHKGVCEKEHMQVSMYAFKGVQCARRYVGMYTCKNVCV